MAEAEKPDLTILTVNLLSAYVTNNNVPSNELADLIRSTRAALESNAALEASAETASYEPAVSVRKSRASRDHLISLIDGKPYKTLKRHLSAHGLTPAQYRERYKLPDDYPMVAPAYSEHRREVAQRLGLGRKKQDAAPAVATPVAAAETVGKPKSQRKERQAPQPAPAARKSSSAPDEKTVEGSAKTRKPRAGKLSLFNAASDGKAASKEASGRQRRKAASPSTAAKQERAAPDDKASPTTVAE